MDFQLDNTAIGKRIKRRRMQQGLSQSELAAAIGISQTHMSNLEHGKVGMTLEVLVKLSQLLSCSLEDIVFEPQAAKEDPVTAALPPENSRLEDYKLSDLIKAIRLLQTIK